MTDAEKLAIAIANDPVWFATKLLEKFTLDQILNAYSTKKKQEEITNLQVQIASAQARLAELQGE